MERSFKSRVIISTLGLLLLSVALELWVILNYGYSSIDTSILIISHFTNTSYQVGLMIFQGSLVILNFIFLAKKAEIKKSELVISFLTSFVIMLLIQAASWFLLKLDIQQSIWMFLLTFLIYVEGISFLVVANLLVAPSDKFVIALAKIFGRSYGLIKVIMDTVLLVVCVIIIKMIGLDIKITFVTLLLTFATGLFANMFAWINRKWLVVLK